MKNLNVVRAGGQPPATAPGAAPDVMTHHTKHWTLLADGDRARILKLVGKKGDKTPMHSHPATAIYVVRGGRGRVILPDGTVQEKEFRTGEAFLRGPETHSDEILDDVEIIYVEFKK